MVTGIVKDRRYLDHDMGAGHVESPRRLSAVYSLIELGLPYPYVTAVPRPARKEEIEYIHAPEYVEFVSSTAGKPMIYLDPDTSTSPKSYDTALLAAGGAMKAADLIMDGEVQNGFALVRPPGHHAEFNQARGFCIFNNIAVAAEHLVRRRGLKRILIADWDLHHGNGTQHAFYSRKDVLFFSTHQFPYYPGSGYWDEVGAGEGEGFTVNVPLSPGKGDSDYLFIYRQILSPIARAFKPEFILVSAGFDISKGDPLGGMRLTGAGFASLAAELRGLASECCGGKILFILEGGYDLAGLAEGVRRVLAVLSGWGESPAGRADISISSEKELAPVVDIQKKYWPL
jgi:acetoin utilization deacetylase AcuC-like enzyme